MSHKNYQTYTKEFILEALELLKNSGKSASQVERELGILPGLLGKRRDQYQVTSTDMQEVVLEPSDQEAARPRSGV